jgi:glycosyltransferase involved in cell wall biosynthesis
MVVKVIPEAKLVIVGEGPLKGNLVEEAKDLKENILFTGIISHSEKVKLIKSPKFMVFPSLIEGFGIAIIEGFACSKPVIVANVGPPSDTVKDGGDWFRCGSFRYS